MIIKIINEIGDQATDMQQGDYIYERIVSAFNTNQNVEIDFFGMKTILSAFLNSAFGTLYKDYSNEFLSNNLKIVNMHDEDMFIFKKILARANDFYSNPQKITEVLDDNF